MIGKFITIRFRLPQGKFGETTARINATQNKSIVRLTLCKGDSGRLVKAPIIAGCLAQRVPYRWT